MLQAPLITKLTNKSKFDPWCTSSVCVFRSTVQHAEWEPLEQTHALSFISLRNQL